MVELKDFQPSFPCPHSKSLPPNRLVWYGKRAAPATKTSHRESGVPWKQPLRFAARFRWALTGRSLDSPAGGHLCLRQLSHSRWQEPWPEQAITVGGPVMGRTVATWRITPVSEIRNRRRPEVCCGELAAEQSTFGSGQVSAGLPSNRRGQLGERCSPRESTITQLGTNRNPLKTNAQRQSQSRTPSVAVLYSPRVTNVFRSRSALRPAARRLIEHQHSFAP